MIPCIRINSQNRPKEIPLNKFVVEGEKYHITFIALCLPQNILAFSIYEKPLNESNAPYEYFGGYRFGIAKEDLEAFFQMCKDCHDLNDLDIEMLIENSKLETV